MLFENVIPDPKQFAESTNKFWACQNLGFHEGWADRGWTPSKENISRSERKKKGLERSHWPCDWCKKHFPQFVAKFRIRIQNENSQFWDLILASDNDECRWHFTNIYIEEKKKKNQKHAHNITKFILNL